MYWRGFKTVSREKFITFIWSSVIFFLCAGFQKWAKMVSRINGESFMSNRKWFLGTYILVKFLSIKGFSIEICCTYIYIYREREKGLGVLNESVTYLFFKENISVVSMGFVL